MGSDSMVTGGETFEFEVEPSIVPYIADAALRLSYIDQSFTVAAAGTRLRITTRGGVDRDAIIRKINHALYREKIRVESAPLRARFLELLSQR